MKTRNLIVLYGYIGALTACETKTLPQEIQTAATETKPAKPKNKATKDWSLASIKDSKLKFRNGKEFDTKLADIQFIGPVEIPNQSPYLLYSGRYCYECDARQMVYIAKPDEPAPDVGFGKNRLMHPGEMHDIKTNEVLFKARTFYGQVLNNTKGVIWYQESLSDYGSYIQNIFLVKLNEAGRTDTSFAFNNSYLQQTLALFEKGACKEVKGLEYFSEP